MSLIDAPVRPTHAFAVGDRATIRLGAPKELAGLDVTVIEVRQVCVVRLPSGEERAVSAAGLDKTEAGS